MHLFVKPIIAALLIGGSCLSISARNQAQDDKIAKAVLGVYNQELDEDPTNYNVYFRRAHFYYGQDQFMRALSDIDNAIKYTPTSDTDLLCQEYSLRANIYLMTDRTAEALTDITKAYECDPTSYVLLYQKANIEYELGKYAEAKEDFKKLQRYHKRSLESLIGQARVAIKENNLGLANEFADQAVALYPSEGEAYMRRASVRAQMGNNTGAVDDILLALSVDKNSSKAVSELVKMSNTDYNAVITGLSNAISQAPNVGMFYYIRAIIAQAHFHYTAAITDFNTIITKKLYNYHGIHGSLAECYYALCDYQKALDEINYAIGSTQDNAAYYITRSKIRLAMGDQTVALESAMMALEKSPENNRALIQKAICADTMQKFNDASEYLGEAIINDPGNAYPYIMRGWILANSLNKKTDANNFFERAANIENADTDINSLKGFALLALGRVDEATAWIRGFTGTDTVDGLAEYYATALFSQAGMPDEAFMMMEKALEKGYSNLYNWKDCNDANINVAPIRTDGRFEALLDKYSYLFK